MSSKSKQVTSVKVTKTNTEEVNIPPVVVESIKQTVETWFNVYGEELITKIIEKQNTTNVTILNNIHLTLQKISEDLSSSLPLSQITVVKEITFDEAKKIVKSYLQEHKKADTDELLVKLGIELETLVKVLDELKQSGDIEAID